MIEISRSVVRRFRAVLKKLAALGNPHNQPMVVVFRADCTGLRIIAQNSQITLEYMQAGAPAGAPAAEEIALNAEALADFEARKDSPVRLETKQGNTVACWQDKAVPQIRHYGAVDWSQVPQMPTFPTHMERQPLELLTALRDASDSAGTDAVRYAVTCLLLRGRTGQVVGTDGRQLLVQSGFTFGWDGDVLVPASAVFGCRALHGQEPILIGRTDEVVALSLGPWTLRLAIKKDGRFPPIDAIVANVKGTATVLQLDPADRQFLLSNLDSLPGAADDHAPVTIEGNGRVIVRCRGSEQFAPTQVVLARSEAQGRKVSFATDRIYLARALRLGFDRVNVYAADRPVDCRDEKRQYIWQILGKDDVVNASTQAVHLSSIDEATVPVAPVPAPTVPVAAFAEETTLTAPHAPPIKPEPPQPEGQPREATTNGSDRIGIAAVLADAEAIKELLHQAFSRMHQLVASVKRYRRQAQAVKNALGSLRQLREVDD